MRSKLFIVFLLVLLSGCAMSDAKKASAVGSDFEVLIKSGCEVAKYRHVAKLGVTEVECRPIEY